jgi:hypothetical protein
MIIFWKWSIYVEIKVKDAENVTFGLFYLRQNFLAKTNFILSWADFSVKRPSSFEEEK